MTWTSLRNTIPQLGQWAWPSLAAEKQQKRTEHSELVMNLVATLVSPLPWQYIIFMNLIGTHTLHR